MIKTHLLGFTHLGLQRELEAALEAHAMGELNVDQVHEIGRLLRQRHWALQRDAGLDWVTVGDFGPNDRMTRHLRLFGGEPSLAMAPWFNTRSHFAVPDFHTATRFQLDATCLLDEVRDAQALGHAVKPVLLGPLSFLWLGLPRAVGFDRLTLLDDLLPVYEQLLAALAALGVEWVQVDEPILGLPIPGPWALAFERTYHAFKPVNVKLLLATYFAPLEHHIAMACKLPVAGLHVDAVSAPHELRAVVDWLPPHKVLSVGVVDGCTIWRTDLDLALRQLRSTLHRRHDAPLWIAPSCSLLQVPVSFGQDPALDAELRSWLAGAVEKLAELQVLKRAMTEGDSAVRGELFRTRAAVAARAASPRAQDAAAIERLAGMSGQADRHTEVDADADADAETPANAAALHEPG